jgi:hypothetical protein
MEKVDIMDTYSPTFGDMMDGLPPNVGDGHSGQTMLLSYTEKARGSILCKALLRITSTPIPQPVNRHALHSSQ